MCYCDLESPEFFSENDHVARKQYVCCECGSTIDPGERYWRFSGKWEGEVETYKMCDVCKQVLKHALYDDDYECIAFGCLYETVGSDFEEEVVI